VPLSLTARAAAGRFAVVTAAVAVGYYYSLATLIRGLALDTPLAYLGLVPFIALALIVVRGLAPRSEPEIHDRHVDYIVGTPLLLLALAVVLILPIHESTFFWLWRLDLLSLPFFVAGAVCIVFGLRALWRLRFPVAFLFLAWPLPFSTVLTGVLDGFTTMTTRSLTLITQLVPIAQPAAGYDGSVFAVNHDGQSFVVAVASACSGVNGVVGFLLIGLAFGFLVHGSLIPKSIWLVGGMLLVWVLNVARILLVFAVGRQWGEAVAIDWIHPVVGLVFFNLGVLAMLLAMPLFRLDIGARTTSASRPKRPTPIAQARPRLAVVRAGVACMLVVLAGVTGMVANARMEQYQLVAQDLGAPRLTDLSVANASISGWSLAKTDTFSWAQQYFGPQSNWMRYQYDWQQGAPGASTFQSSEPVIMDVISTNDLYTFSTYGLEACYQFHDYRVMDTRTIDLAGGVTGHAVTYYNPAIDSDWIAVYWEWPVVGTSGYRYERVILNLLRPVGEHLAAPPLSASMSSAPQFVVNDWLLGSSKGALSTDLTDARNFLVGFAQQVVTSAASQTGQA